MNEVQKAAYRAAVNRAHKIGSDKELQERAASDIVKDDFPYFKTKPGDDPDVNVNKDLLEVIQSAGENLAGESSLTISSGKRGKARTLKQLDVELKQFNNLSSPQKEAIKPLLLRGSWEDHLQNNYKFTNLVDTKQELNKLVDQGILTQNQSEKLLSSDYSSGKLKQARKEFGGFRSAHVPKSEDSLVKGDKIDIPYSSLGANRPTKQNPTWTNTGRVTNLLDSLKQVPGVEILNEPKKGVIDLRFTGNKQEALNTIQGIKQQEEFNQMAMEPVSQQEWNREANTETNLAEIDMIIDSMGSKEERDYIVNFFGEDKVRRYAEQGILESKIVKGVMMNRNKYGSMEAAVKEINRQSFMERLNNATNRTNNK